MRQPFPPYGPQKPKIDEGGAAVSLRLSPQMEANIDRQMERLKEIIRQHQPHHLRDTGPPDESRCPVV